MRSDQAKRRGERSSRGRAVAPNRRSDRAMNTRFEREKNNSGRNSQAKSRNHAGDRNETPKSEFLNRVKICTNEKCF